jgi:hypothetical protein
MKNDPRSSGFFAIPGRLDTPRPTGRLVLPRPVQYLFQKMKSSANDGREDGATGKPITPSEALTAALESPASVTFFNQQKHTQ